MTVIIIHRYIMFWIKDSIIHKPYKLIILTPPHPLSPCVTHHTLNPHHTPHPLSTPYYTPIPPESSVQAPEGVSQIVTPLPYLTPHPFPTLRHIPSLYPTPQHIPRYPLSPTLNVLKFYALIGLKPWQIVTRRSIIQEMVSIA